MKRIFTLIVALVLVLGMTQCRKKALDPSSNGAEMITVTVTAGLGGNSKTDITSAGKVTWNVGDKIYYGKDASNVSVTEVTAVGPNASHVDGKIATFTVSVEKNTKYHFYYCGNNVPTTEAGRVIKFDDQTNTGNDLENIANCYHINYGTATLDGTGVTTIGMNNIMSIGKFNLTKIDDNNFTVGEDILMIGLPNAIQLTFDDEKFKVGSMVTEEQETPTSKDAITYFAEGARGNVYLRGAGGNDGKYVALVPATNNGSTTAMRLYFGGIGTSSITASNTKGYVEMSSGVVHNQLYTGSGSGYVPVKPDRSPFSVSECETVYFSPGNLYYDYDATTPSKWYFESNSYDCRSYFNGRKVNVLSTLYSPAVINGVYNEKGTPATTGCTDGDWGLFGWSTDAKSNNWGMYTVTSATTGTTDGNFNDWGKNTINYSGTLPSGWTGTLASTGWFALSNDQWAFLLGRMATLSDGTYTYSPSGDKYLFAEASITLSEGTINGLVILPDNFTLPSGCGFNSNPNKVSRDSNGRVTHVTGVEYKDNTYTTDLWEKMKNAGAIFLPSIGNRSGEVLGDMNEVNTHTNYWSSTAPSYSTSMPYVFNFYNYNIFPKTQKARTWGYAVRLVHY